jgi:hypothetical protein
MARWATYSSYSIFYDGSDMTAEETEFLLAMASYQKRFDRRYPTWLEALNVLRCLGYRKTVEPVPICEPIPPTVANPDREFEFDDDEPPDQPPTSRSGFA